MILEENHLGKIDSAFSQFSQMISAMRDGKLTHNQMIRIRYPYIKEIMSTTKIYLIETISEENTPVEIYYQNENISMQLDLSFIEFLDLGLKQERFTTTFLKEANNVLSRLDENFIFRADVQPNCITLISKGTPFEFQINLKREGSFLKNKYINISSINSEITLIDSIENYKWSIFMTRLTMHCIRHTVGAILKNNK